MKHAPLLIVLLLASCFFPYLAHGAATITGEQAIWHKITLTFDGPDTAETATPNPFIDYRLSVTFQNTSSAKTYTVPGYYAADGNAAETSASSGNKRRVHFAPDETGEWTYETSFRKGGAIAISDSPGESAGFMDGETGRFRVQESRQAAPDLRAKGRLQFVGEHYLRFAGTGEYFLKCGADAPENLLAYDDIDDTPNVKGFRKNWSPHLRDYSNDADDLLWGSGKDKGKGLLGAINYLSSKGMNAFSFLTFNVDGDDHNVYSYLLRGEVAKYEAYAADNKGKDAKGWDMFFHHYRFDCSKMDQWERVFEYGDRKGMYLHFKTSEAENCFKMDGGDLGTVRKLYYRELIARYSHHLALNWNIGEECTQSSQQIKDAAAYLAKTDPYGHNIVLHSHGRDSDYEKDYRPLLGNASSLTGLSMQINQPDFTRVHGAVAAWVKASAESGKKWVVACDEPGDAQHALVTDIEDPTRDLPRKNALWGALMAGGAGVEWYFGYRHPESDLTCQDWRSRDNMWDQCRHALKLFRGIPFHEMVNDNELSSNEDSYCFAKANEVYAVYLKNGGSTELDLTGVSGRFSISWFNPRIGSTWIPDTILQGGSLVSLGFPPTWKNQDWAVLVQKVKN